MTLQSQQKRAWLLADKNANWICQNSAGTWYCINGHVQREGNFWLGHGRKELFTAEINGWTMKDTLQHKANATELNPPTDTLATTDTDGWIEEGGNINTEMEIFRERME